MTGFLFQCPVCHSEFEAGCTEYQLTDSREWDQGGPIAKCVCARCGSMAYSFPLCGKTAVNE